MARLALDLNFLLILDFVQLLFIFDNLVFIFCFSIQQFVLLTASSIKYLEMLLHTKYPSHHLEVMMNTSGTVTGRYIAQAKGKSVMMEPQPCSTC